MKRALTIFGSLLVAWAAQATTYVRVDDDDGAAGAE